MAELLLATILVDTVNLDRSKARATPSDIEVAAQVRKMFNMTSVSAVIVTLTPFFYFCGS